MWARAIAAASSSVARRTITSASAILPSVRSIALRLRRARHEQNLLPADDIHLTTSADDDDEREWRAWSHVASLSFAWNQRGQDAFVNTMRYCAWPFSSDTAVSTTSREPP